MSTEILSSSATLVISANFRPDSPAADVAEPRSILDSIEIVPITG
jgi:hypothetical protein